MTEEVKKHDPCSCPEEIDEDERRKIALHKYYLSLKAGKDVGWDCACRDWMDNYSKKWKHYKMKKESQEEIMEILKHKWLESEKAGHDMGDDAVLDWVLKYASEWRDHKQKKPK